MTNDQKTKLYQLCRTAKLMSGLKYSCTKGKNTFCRSIWHPLQAFSFGDIFSAIKCHLEDALAYLKYQLCLQYIL